MYYLQQNCVIVPQGPELKKKYVLYGEIVYDLCFYHGTDKIKNSTQYFYCRVSCQRKLNTNFILCQIQPITYNIEYL